MSEQHKEVWIRSAPNEEGNREYTCLHPNYGWGARPGSVDVASDRRVIRQLVYKQNGQLLEPRRYTYRCVLCGHQTQMIMLTSDFAEAMEWLAEE